MSGLLDVLDACRQISATATGVTTAYLNTPETVPANALLPATITRYDTEQRGTINLNGLEEWQHPIEQILLVRRLGNRAGEDAEVMPFLEALIAQYRANATVLGTGALMNDLEYQIGPYTFFNEDFWGASLHLRVEELLEVQAQISA